MSPKPVETKHSLAYGENITWHPYLNESVGCYGNEIANHLLQMLISGRAAGM